MHSSGQQNFEKNRVETAWIMPGDYGWDQALFFSIHAKQFGVRVKMSAEEEIHCRVYVNVVRSETEKGNKRNNFYAARRSRKP